MLGKRRQGDDPLMQGTGRESFLRQIPQRLHAPFLHDWPGLSWREMALLRWFYEIINFIFDAIECSISMKAEFNVRLHE